MTATATENQVILLKKDYEILNDYVKNLHGMRVNEKENFAKLSQELGKAHSFASSATCITTGRTEKARRVCGIHAC